MRASSIAFSSPRIFSSCAITAAIAAAAVVVVVVVVVAGGAVLVISRSLARCCGDVLVCVILLADLRNASVLF